MKKVKLFEEYSVINEDKIKMALDNIDKWMPDDAQLQDEYYELINDGDVEGMKNFLDTYAEEDGLMKYGIKYKDLDKLAKAIIGESKYNGNIAGDAAEYIAKELSQYVKGIIDQPNDKQTFLHLKDKSYKSKVIKALKDIYGLEAYDGGTQFSPSPTIKFDNDQILESTMNEASTGAVDQFAADERADGYDAKVFLGRFDGKKTFKAQVTNKTWGDGTPVTKYFSRGGFKDVKLKGEYQLVDSDRGWWYIQGPAGDWFAVKHDDYGTPPFEF